MLHFYIFKQKYKICVRYYVKNKNNDRKQYENRFTDTLAEKYVKIYELNLNTTQAKIFKLPLTALRDLDFSNFRYFQFNFKTVASSFAEAQTFIYCDILFAYTKLLFTIFFLLSMSIHRLLLFSFNILKNRISSYFNYKTTFRMDGCKLIHICRLRISSSFSNVKIIYLRN